MGQPIYVHLRIVNMLLLASILPKAAYCERVENLRHLANPFESRRNGTFACQATSMARRDRVSRVSTLNGGAIEQMKTETRWDLQLPMGFVRPRTITMLWYIPWSMAIFSFWTFPWTSSWFHTVAQWSSANTWFPHTQEGVNLQTNVIVRRVKRLVTESKST